MNYSKSVYYRKFRTLKIMSMHMEAINKWNAMQNAIWKMRYFTKQHPVKSIKENIIKILANLR